MKSLAPIDTCLHPQQLNIGGEILFVPCQKCASCLKSKQNKWAHRLDHEQRNSASTLFISLTYANIHLPLVTYNPLSSTISSVSHTKFDKAGNPFRVSIIDDYIQKDLSFPHIFTNYINFPITYEPTHITPTSFIKKPIKKPINFISLLNQQIINPLPIPHYVTNRVNNVPVFDTSYTFAICLRKDIQDFLKRLRILLQRDTTLIGRDISFRYFICSEYGPETFRPHYHGLLFFNDPYIASLCNTSYINKAWRKSTLNETQLREQSKFVTVGKGSSFYTSKYVTGTDDLPLVLRNKFFKPFYLSSHATPIGSSAISSSLIAHKVKNTNLLYNETYQDKDTREFITQQLSYPLSCWRKYFPKFVFSRNLPLSFFQACFARIFSLPLFTDIPNYTHILERKYALNCYFHTGSRQVHYIKPTELDNSIDQELWDSIFKSLNIKHNRKSYLIFGYDTLDTFYKVTYSDILPFLFKDYQYNITDFVDLYLFGIPQNRTSVNKILRLREQNLDFCSDSFTYQYYYNLYHTKCFNNQLQQQYETFNTLHSGLFTIQDIQEIYPSFYYSLPKNLSAFNQETKDKVDYILQAGFDLTVDDFYHNDILINNYFNIYYQQHYKDYRSLITYKSRETKTKRKHYYKKLGCGESITTSAPPYSSTYPLLI